MTKNHEAYYKCGFCNKHTLINDEDLAKYVCEGMKPLLEFKSPCSCGHFSYASSIRFKAQVNAKDWRGCYGSSK